MASTEAVLIRMSVPTTEKSHCFQWPYQMLDIHTHTSSQGVEVSPYTDDSAIDGVPDPVTVAE
jgi:hypothetical protein